MARRALSGVARRGRDTVARLDVVVLDCEVVKRVEVIEDGHIVAVAGEPLGQIAADETCPAGDENTHYRNGESQYVNYPTLLAHGRCRSLLEGRASCFYDALCRY